MDNKMENRKERLLRLEELFSEAEVLLSEEFEYKGSSEVHFNKELDEKNLRKVKIWKNKYHNLSLKA
jgi:hypothetical protein